MNGMVNAMHASSQPQSRWAGFVERWDERVTRFRQNFDPFSDTVDRRRKIWAMAALSIGVLALGTLLVLGTIWMVENYTWFRNHHAGVLILSVLKLWKLFGIGAAIVLGFLFRDQFSGKTPDANAQNGGTAPAKE
jgi:hypothetical protein